MAEQFGGQVIVSQHPLQALLQGCGALLGGPGDALGDRGDDDAEHEEHEREADCHVEHRPAQIQIHNFSLVIEFP
jgi:hypothetical protein